LKPWLQNLAQGFNRIVASPIVKLAIPAVILVAALWLIRQQLREVELSAIVAALAATPAWAIALAAGFTAASYLCLAAVEWRLLSVIGHPQPLARTVVRSLTANALSSFVGFGPVSGTALRVRVYASARLPVTAITQLVFFHTAATYLAGVVSLGIASLIALRPISTTFSLPLWLAGVGALLLLSPAALWFVLFRHARRGGVAPGGLDRSAALGAGLGDWLFSGAALFVLTSDPLSGFPAFLAIFCLGSLLGGLAGVPGGLGVLEATVLGLHAGGLAHTTAAALILYRVIYLLGPAAIAMIGLVGRRLFAVVRH
jgi:uncharacterized membrane protein YbhN (UPF0104 family)